MIRKELNLGLKLLSNKTCYATLNKQGTGCEKPFVWVRSFGILHKKKVEKIYSHVTLHSQS